MEHLLNLSNREGCLIVSKKLMALTKTTLAQLIKVDLNTSFYNECFCGLMHEKYWGLYYKTFYGRNLRIFTIS